MENFIFCEKSYKKSLRKKAFSVIILIKKYLNFGVFQRTSTLNLSKVPIRDSMENFPNQSLVTVSTLEKAQTKASQVKLY